MPKLALTVGAISLLASAASAQPYVWVPGSSQDTPKTGNRMAVVDVATGQIVGPANGWQYMPTNPGADPLIPTFITDRNLTLILVGGDSDEDVTGRLFLFGTSAVIDNLRNNTPENIAPISSVTLAGSGADASEPVNVVYSPEQQKVYVIDSSTQLLYQYQLNPNNSLTSLGTLATGPSPGPFWVTGNRGVHVSSADFSIRVYNLETNQFIKTVSVPSPSTGTVTGTFPLCFGALGKRAPSNQTIVPPADEAPFGDFFVVSGYWGIKTYTNGFPPFIPPGYNIINDDYTYYRYQVANDILGTVESVNPPGTETVFPPTTQPATNASNQTFVQVGGGRVYRDDGTNQKLLVADSDMVLAYLVWGDDAAVTAYAGSVSVPIAESLIGGQYVSRTQYSRLYRYDRNEAATNTLTPIAQVERKTTLVLGTGGGKIVAAANDIFGLPGVDGTVGTSAPRDTQIILHDIASRATTVVQLELVGGAAALSPYTKTMETPTPTMSPTLTATASPTEIATASPSQSPTVSPSATDAQTPTPTDVATASPSQSPTASPSATDAQTPTPTDVATVTPTDIATATPTEVATASPTESPTLTPSPTPGTAFELVLATLLYPQIDPPSSFQFNEDGVIDAADAAFILNNS